NEAPLFFVVVEVFLHIDLLLRACVVILIATTYGNEVRGAWCTRNDIPALGVLSTTSSSAVEGSLQQEGTHLITWCCDQQGTVFFRSLAARNRQGNLRHVAEKIHQISKSIWNTDTMR
ncbi:unnamed protein product, partial [Amoebophrya sp. A25]